MEHLGELMLLLLRSSCEQGRVEAFHCCNSHWVEDCSSPGRHPIVEAVDASPWLEIETECPDEGAVRSDTC